jgi:Eco57I restriction-modification methylase
MDRVRRLAAERGCFHWPLEFPEVFLAATGRPSPDGGFDAVVGNPPWEMLRADHGPSAGAAVRFSRESGIYRAQSHGHANQYQLFVERALSLLRPGGRLGLLVPGGLLTDHGAADLRAQLLQRHGLESLLVFDNRKAIFPIHRGLRFAAMTAVARQPAAHVACRFGLETTDRLEQLSVASRHDFPIALTPALIERLSSEQMAIPDLPDERDLRLVEALSAAHPPLANCRGWNARFGRELNASDDKACWEDGGRAGGSLGVRGGGASAPQTLPVIEGKHLDPFVVDLDSVTKHAAVSAVRARLGRAAAFDRPRLAYREVAAVTNRLTLIAAILPPHCVSVHTVFCLRTSLTLEEQDVLCALLNSFVANYLVRRWVTTHVTASIVERLPVPRPPRGTRQFSWLAGDAARLRIGDRHPDLLARMQAAAAHVYGISADDYAYVLDSFPLIPADERRAALQVFASGTRR